MWDALAHWPGAVALRQSSTLYLFVNAAHILGIGLILGPILALDARMIGWAKTVPLPVLGPFLSGTAKLGVVVAVLTGIVLFSVRPADYADNPAFLSKIGLVLVAVANAVAVDRSRAWRDAIATNEIAARLRVQAAASAGLWIAALVAGRWIGFL